MFFRLFMLITLRFSFPAYFFQFRYYHHLSIRIFRQTPSVFIRPVCSINSLMVALLSPSSDLKIFDTKRTSSISQVSSKSPWMYLNGTFAPDAKRKTRIIASAVRPSTLTGSPIRCHSVNFFSTSSIFKCRGDSFPGDFFKRCINNLWVFEITGKKVHGLVLLPDQHL